MKSSALVLAAALFVPTVAAAQTAKENFSYSAPSGMFSEGTLKWNMYRFMHEDAERMAARRAAPDPTATGSIQGSATSLDSVRRPGEVGRRRPGGSR
jgi:hypothetical protein